MIKITSLYKKFNSLNVLDNVNLEVEENKIFGLIGPDGAGKTTFLRILAGIMTPASGDVLFDNKSILKNTEEIKSLIGYMPQKFSLYGDLTVMENLNFYADIYLVSGIERKNTIARLLEFSNLSPFKNRFADKLSGGMKQKLGLACSLIHKPEVLLLDEPTNGVDPLSRREFWNILDDLKNQGVTIIISTPYMDEAEKCNTIGLIEKGRIIYHGSPGGIKNKYKGNVAELITSDNNLAVKIAEKMIGIREITIKGETIHINFEENSDKDSLPELLDKNNINVISFKDVLPTIEDAFIYLAEESEKWKTS
ncbi:MAG: ABC transporter ATP-binding protein [Actinobacteria bacterium]|nr:ABC transporter ATP-binding protein [Actinomycetota bacterium]